MLSGAAVETTATFDAQTDEFVITSPTPSAAKTWISQGLFAERAVILATLVVDGKALGPHLFWAPIADHDFQLQAGGRPVPRPGVSLISLPGKTTLLGLDNAEISFSNFRVPRAALLSRFGSLSAAGEYESRLPKGCTRLLDLLLSRLLTGRIVLSEATLAHALSRLRRNYGYCSGRELWKGKKDKGPRMADMPLVSTFFRDYGRTLCILQTFVAHTRESVAEAIRKDQFTNDTIEATCMCKFLGTGFGADSNGAVRKIMGARGIQSDAALGVESFLPNATCAAEGDNTIMELKIVQDCVRGRTPKVPVALMLRLMVSPQGRKACGWYLLKFARAFLLGKRALKDGQLLKDIAWARAHMRVVDVWQKSAGPERGAWLESYERVLLQMPTRVQW